MNRKPSARVFVSSAVCGVLVAASLALGACGRTPTTLRPVTRQEVEAFVDDFFPSRLSGLHIPGLVFVVVRDGEVLLAKGYGLASLEQELVVDPERTAFCIGSVSKLFVAIAAQQLVETGQLDLQADINKYLRTFQVQNPFTTTLTMEHLLTHTSGIQDPSYVSDTDPTDRVELGHLLATELPDLSTAPGESFAYSSYGSALAAYVVQEVSGQPFDAYVEEHIFRPLGMSQSSYLLSPPVPDGLAVGYAYQAQSYVAQPLDYDDEYPAGAVVSTAPDMAVFLGALLNDGCSEAGCILRPGTLAEMFRPRVDLPSSPLRQALAFVEGQLQGQRVLGHTGATRGFGATLDTFPDHNVGYFLAFNAECYLSSACSIISEFRQAFVERFLPSS